jgi:hypothetical protein
MTTTQGPKTEQNAGPATRRTEKAPPTEQPYTSGFDQGREVIAALRGPAADSVAGVQQACVIAIHTGDVPGGGTDGDVWVWVDGSSGVRSNWLFEDNNEDNFEQNKTDYFWHVLPDLGTPVSCWVYFRPLGNRPDWYLDTVNVNGKTFAFYKWITTAGMYQGTPT